MSEFFRIIRSIHKKGEYIPLDDQGSEELRCRKLFLYMLFAASTVILAFTALSYYDNKHVLPASPKVKSSQIYLEDVYIKLGENEYLISDRFGNLKIAPNIWIHGGKFRKVVNIEERVVLFSPNSEKVLVFDKSNQEIRFESVSSDFERVLFEIKHSKTLNFLNQHHKESLISKLGISRGSKFTLSTEPVIKIRGVNIGSWFIPERWINQEFYQGIDEFSSQLCGLVTKLGRDDSESRMLLHLKTWVTSSDLDTLQNAGIRHLRVPLGYWNIIDSPYSVFVPKNTSTALFFLDWIMSEAASRNMSVLLDLHGAPGSQNGYDHSGCGYDSNEGEGWSSKRHIKLSLQAIEKLILRYKNYPNLLGIELLNEPGSYLENYGHDVLLAYYKEAYEIVRSHDKEVLIIVSILWEKYYEHWKNELLEPEYYNVVLDWHSYGFDNMNYEERLDYLQHITGLIKNNSLSHEIVIGEWSVYYHRKPDEDEYVIPENSFLQMQLDSYEHALGWYFWNFKVRIDDKRNLGWSYLDMITMGYNFENN